jgi:tRNA(Arg) A34 adenosine deaminase TadA
MQGNPVFMQKAIALATENVVTVARVARLARSSCAMAKIIATGVNLRHRNNDPTAHAEVMAIREACARWAHSADRLRGLYQLRALPDVSRGDLLVALRGDLLRQYGAGRG